MSSSTRLLVLATVRLLQPVHGYDVRRELLSWRADQWANVAPGSIYSALKVLVKDGLVEVVGTDQAGGRPARTTYRISPEGEKEMSALLREAWWNVTPPTDPFLACIALLYNLPQDEVTAAVQHRIRQLETAVESNRFII